MGKDHKLDDINIIVLSNQKEKIKNLQKTVGSTFLSLTKDQQKDLVMCYPQILLSFPAPRSKDLILTAVSIDYNLISSLEISEVDDEVMTLAIETCNDFESRMSWAIETVLRKKEFSQENQNLIVNYWSKEMSGYSIANSLKLSQETLCSIIKKRPKIFEDVAPNCAFEACKTAILKTYENVKFLSLCKNLTDLEMLELSRLALSRNENAFRYISVIKAKDSKEALAMLDKKIKLCQLMG